MAQNGNKLSVTVVGETSFPNLIGEVEGSTVQLFGLAKTGRPRPTSMFRLKLDGKTLAGTRYYIGLMREKLTGVPNGGATCLQEFEIAATKQ